MIIQNTQDSNQKAILMINTKNLSNFDQFKHQAEIGCAEAQFLLGIYYFIRISDNGIHSKYSGELILSRNKDKLLSIPVYFAMGNADSPLSLGECCLTIAFEWFEKAAIQGYIAAHEWLALLYREGLGVEKNDILAYSHILYAAENNGSLDAYYQLSLCYLNGLGTEKKPEKGIEWCLKAVEKNHPESLYLLAYCYFEGNGVAKDLLIGLDWLNKAKEIKEIVIEYRIMMLLAEAYANGLGLEKNNELALVWYEKILEKISSEEYIEVWNQENGFLNGDSYFKAAVFYFDIKGEKPIFEKGIRFLFKAIECQYAGAIQFLDNAVLQFTFPEFIGRDDVEQCYQYAYNWLVKAYEERPTDPEVNFVLGVLLLTGKGISRNSQKAKEYFHKFWSDDAIDYRDDHDCSLMFTMAYLIAGDGQYCDSTLQIFFTRECLMDVERNGSYIILPSLIMDFYLKNREFDLLRSYVLLIKNSPKVFEQPSTHKKFVEIMEQLVEKDEELKQANQQLLLKEKELEEMMSMFAHKFRSPLDTIIYNTNHEHQPKLYIQAAQTMRGLLDIFSIISADDVVLIERLKGDNQGDSGLLTVFSKTLDMILLHLLSAQAAEKIQQHYLRYAKKQGLCDAELSYKQWNDDYFELERQLQMEWEQSFAELLSQQATLEQRLAWLEERFFKLELQGFEQANIQFKEYGITESFLTILLNEILVNSFKYYSSDTQQPVVLAWVTGDNYQVLSCRNPSARNERNRFKGSGKGHTFLSALARKTSSQFTKPKPQDDFVLEFGIDNQLLLSN